MTSPKSYVTLKAQLDELLAWFEGDDIDIDEALKKYETAIKLTQELEKYLTTTENKLSDLKAQLPEV